MLNENRNNVGQASRLPAPSEARRRPVRVVSARAEALVGQAERLPYFTGYSRGMALRAGGDADFDAIESGGVGRLVCLA
jgi:hypothetical protein